MIHRFDAGDSGNGVTDRHPAAVMAQNIAND